MRVKVCGITRLEDALDATSQGAWALGFNFYPHSLRFIQYRAAKEIITSLPSKVIKVGIFIDVDDAEITNRLAELKLDYAQVYSHKKRPKSLLQRMILALQAKDEASLPAEKFLMQYNAILLDAKPLADNLKGGTGRLANWSLAKKLAKKYKAILQVNPYAVDVASGVEAKPRIKDKAKIKAFLEACREE